jgi:CRP-like cAMP-binding protein
VPASATVRAITKCKLLVVPRHRFHLLLQLVHDFADPDLNPNPLALTLVALALD